MATMLYAHSRTAGQQRRQISGVVSCAASAAKQHQRIIQYGPIRVFVLLKPAQEARDLLTQEQIVLCKLQLPIFVAGVGQVVMSSCQAQFNRESIADSHAVFAIQHKGNRPSDVRIKRQRDQIKHVAIVLRRFTLGRHIEFQVRVVL